MGRCCILLCKNSFILKFIFSSSFLHFALSHANEASCMYKGGQVQNISCAVTDVILLVIMSVSDVLGAQSKYVSSRP